MWGKENFLKEAFLSPTPPIFQELSNRGVIYFFTLCVDLIFCVSSWASNFIASRTRSATRSVGISNKILLSPRRSCASHTPTGFDFTSFRSGWHEGRIRVVVGADPYKLYEHSTLDRRAHYVRKNFSFRKVFGATFFQKGSKKIQTQTNFFKKRIFYVPWVFLMRGLLSDRWGGRARRCRALQGEALLQIRRWMKIRYLWA